MAGDLILADGLAGDRGRRRIKAQRLLDHRLGDDEAIERGRRKISFALRRVDLPLEPLPPLGREGEEEKAPAQRVGGGLMPRRDEGRDIGLHLIGRETVLERVSLEQQRQKIARRLLAARQKLAAPRDNRLDGSIEYRERRLAPAAPEARQKGRQVERIERMHPPERVEIARDRLRQDRGLAREPIREDRALEHFERHMRHLARRIDRARIGERAPTLDETLGNACHRRLEAFDHAGREGWRERAPLRAPALAFGREEAVAEAGAQHTRLQHALAVVPGVVDENVLDRGRIADDAHRPDDRAHAARSTPRNAGASRW